MLAGLEDVDWRGLAHAHGVAADVPDQLRAVAGDDPQAAEQALYELYGSLWADGSVSPATVAALPFLAALAAAPGLDPGRRVDLLVLLARIGAADQGEGDDRRRVAAALDREGERLGVLLDSEDPQVRAAVAGLAGVLASPPRAWARRLRGLRDAASDPLVRTHLSVAAALAEGRQPDRRDVEAAAAVDPYLASWRGERFEGLLGRRVSRRTAVELTLMLTELALERV